MIGYLVIAFFQVPTHTFPGCCNVASTVEMLVSESNDGKACLLCTWKCWGIKRMLCFIILFSILSLSFALSFLLSFFYPLLYPFFYPFLYISFSIFYSIIRHFQTHPFIADFFILMPISLRDFPARHDSLPESLHLPNSWLVISCYIPFISH